MASTTQSEWRIKITGLPTNVSVVDLAEQLHVRSRQVGIPRNQTDSNTWYAWISGFTSEVESSDLASKWSQTLLFGRRVRCKASENTFQPLPARTHVPKQNNERNIRKQRSMTR